MNILQTTQKNETEKNEYVRRETSTPAPLIVPMVSKKKSHTKRNIGIIVGVIFVVLLLVSLGAAAFPQVGNPVTFGVFSVTGSDSNGYKVAIGLQDAKVQFVATTGTLTLIFYDGSGNSLFTKTYQITPDNFSTYQYVLTGGQFEGVVWFVPSNSFPNQSSGLSQFGSAKITFSGSTGNTFSDTDTLVDLS